MNTTLKEISCLRARYELRRAVEDLRSRGLKLASKWAAEQLNGLCCVNHVIDDISHYSDYPIYDDSSVSPYYDKYLFSKCLLDIGEYQRAATILEVGASNLHLLPREAQFIRYYSTYMAGEKQKEEKASKISNPLERLNVENENLAVLHEQLLIEYKENYLDSFGVYIFGIVLKDMKIYGFEQGPINAFNILFESVSKYPWNWSAWLDLSEVISQFDTVPEVIRMNPSCSEFMQLFFQIHLNQNSFLSSISDLSNKIQMLEDIFPSSLHLMAQKGLAFFNDRNFVDARKVLADSFDKDSLRLDDLYLYAHVLFVDAAKVELSHLAQVAVKVDEYRPETCCILGNFFSLRGEHQRAIMYFNRALKLNSKFHEVWTLLGHEYLELKKTGAAIEYYRQGVAVNPKDFRAWNGLGNTYELMKMHSFALYYFRKAAALRPYDSRMLNALACSLENLGHVEEAIKVLQRSIANVDVEGIALFKLAQLYVKLGDSEKGVKAYLELLETYGIDQLGSEAKLETLMYISEYFKGEGKYSKAEKYASMLLDYNGPQKEQAEALIRQIRATDKNSNSTFLSSDADLEGSPCDISESIIST